MQSSRLILLAVLGTLTLVFGSWGVARTPATAATAHAAPTPTMTASGFVSVTPVRVLDSRPHSEPTARSTTVVHILGHHGLPATGIAAVVVNITAVDPVRPGFVTAYPTGARRPTASNLNYVRGQIVANQAIVKLGSHGRISLYTLARTDLLVDVTGYYPPGSAYEPRNPARILDTRSDETPTDDSTTRLVVAGRAGVPTTGVAAVVLNVTAVSPTGPGFLTAYPAGVSRPVASTLNYATGSVVAGMTIVKVGAGGAIDLYTLASADLVVDVAGWIPAAGDYAPVSPRRVVDTRPGSRVRARHTVAVQISGRHGVPAKATAVEVTITAVKPSASGFLTAYPTGVARPKASMLNYVKGDIVANSATVKLSTSGRITVYTLARSDLIVDITGYYTSRHTTAWVMAGTPTSQANIHSAPRFGSAVVGAYGPHARVSGTIVGAWLHTTRGYVSLGALEDSTSHPSKLNGSIPIADLCPVPLAWNASHSFGGTAGGYTIHYTKHTRRYLNCVALSQLRGLEWAYHKHFGKWATIDLTYRSLYEQEYWWHLLGSPTAATPGTSNHGYGLAIDFEEDDGPDTFSWGHPGQTWLEHHAAAFGFVNPYYYGTPEESYHFQFDG